MCGVWNVLPDKILSWKWLHKYTVDPCEPTRPEPTPSRRPLKWTIDYNQYPRGIIWTQLCDKPCSGKHRCTSSDWRRRRRYGYQYRCRNWGPSRGSVWVRWSSWDLKGSKQRSLGPPIIVFGHIIFTISIYPLVFVAPKRQVMSHWANWLVPLVWFSTLSTSIPMQWALSSPTSTVSGNVPPPSGNVAMLLSDITMSALPRNHLKKCR